MLGQGGNGSHNMQNMVSHNSGTSEVIGNYNNMPNIMQGNNLDINGINQNMVVINNMGPINNISGFNTSMNNMNGMN
jgi:hypothetical protein